MNNFTAEGMHLANRLKDALLLAQINHDTVVKQAEAIREFESNAIYAFYGDRKPVFGLGFNELYEPVTAVDCQRWVDQLDQFVQAAAKVRSAFGPAAASIAVTIPALGNLFRVLDSFNNVGGTTNDQVGVANDGSGAGEAQRADAQVQPESPRFAERV